MGAERPRGATALADVWVRLARPHDLAVYGNGLEHRRVGGLEPRSGEEFREERPRGEHQDDSEHQATDPDEDRHLDPDDRLRVVVARGVVVLVGPDADVT